MTGPSNTAAVPHRTSRSRVSRPVTYGHPSAVPVHGVTEGSRRTDAFLAAIQDLSRMETLSKYDSQSVGEEDGAQGVHARPGSVAAAAGHQPAVGAAAALRQSPTATPQGNRDDAAGVFPASPRGSPRRGSVLAALEGS